MAEVRSLPKLDIFSRDLNYDKSAKRLSLNLLDYNLIGYFKLSTRIKQILDEIYSSLQNIKIQRNLDYKKNLTLGKFSEQNIKHC